MKMLILSAVILFTLFFKSTKAQSTLETKLRNFPISSYLNKPIDTLLAHLPTGFDTAYEVGPTCNINKGATLQVNYSPNYRFWVIINITDAQYITVNKNTRNIPYKVAWPLALLRKEKVGSITIYTGDYNIINEADIY